MKFPLVQYFSITSIVAFIVIASMLFMVQQKVQVDAMVEQQEHQNVNLTRIFTNTIWKDFDFLINKSQGLSNEELKAHPELQRVYELVTTMAKRIEVHKVKAFDLKGRTVFSTDFSQIGDDKSNNGGWLAAMQGQTSSGLSHRGSFDAFEGSYNDIDVVSSYIPVYGDDGKIEGVFEVYSDVTHFLKDVHATQYLVVAGIVGLLALLFIALLLIVRRAGQIIEQQDKDAQKSRLQLSQSEKMASLGNMVASVAHELNTPLAFTRSNVEMATENLENFKLPYSYGNQLIEFINSAKSNPARININTEQLRAKTGDYEEMMDVDDMVEMLTQTMGGLDQMKELVNHLKNYTRIDRGNVGDFDLNSGLENVLFIARSGIPEQIQINREFGELPTIECMPSSLNQVFMNLINNAAQACNPEDGVITIRSKVDGDMVQVEVEDNGKGISDEDIQHIFDAYFTTKGIDEGTGLGLSIVKEIIDQHQGEITVKSKVGAGSTFTVRLPIEAPEEQQEAA